MTDRAAVIDTVQVLLVPEQDPLQPAKDEPLAAAAVSVTEVPEPKLAEQVEPQLIPAGLLVTVPLPVPVLLTVNKTVEAPPTEAWNMPRPCVAAPRVELFSQNS